MIGDREVELEEELEHEYQEDPFDWPAWPGSRTLRPQPGTIPSRPYQTLLPTCRAIYSDLGDLATNLGILRRRRQRRPPDRNLIRIAQDDVGTAFTRIRTRAQNGWYARQGGCTRANLLWLAEQLNGLQGLGATTRTSVVNIVKQAANRAPRP
jgi:hypothetical protein